MNKFSTMKHVTEQTVRKKIGGRKQIKNKDREQNDKQRRKKDREIERQTKKEGQRDRRTNKRRKKYREIERHISLITEERK